MLNIFPMKRECNFGFCMVFIFDTNALFATHTLIAHTHEWSSHSNEHWSPFQRRDLPSSYRDFHSAEKTVSRPTYLYNGNGYIGKATFLNGPLVTVCQILYRLPGLAWPSWYDCTFLVCVAHRLHRRLKRSPCHITLIVPYVRIPDLVVIVPAEDPQN